MTDQRTLKKIINEQRAEIQQLKKQIKATFKTYNEISKLSATRIFDLEKQIETAKQREKDYKRFIEKILDSHSDLKPKWEVFGEKTS